MRYARSGYNSGRLVCDETDNGLYSRRSSADNHTRDTQSGAAQAGQPVCIYLRRSWTLLGTTGMVAAWPGAASPVRDQKRAAAVRTTRLQHAVSLVCRSGDGRCRLGSLDLHTNPRAADLKLGVRG